MADHSSIECNRGGGPIWLPYSRAKLIAIKRCPDCGCHPPTQGHNPKCPTNAPGAGEGSDVA